MEPIWTLVTILGPVLLLVVIVYVWMRNRRAGPENERRAERGARELREKMAEEPDKNVDL